MTFPLIAGGILLVIAVVGLVLILIGLYLIVTGERDSGSDGPEIL